MVTHSVTVMAKLMHSINNESPSETKPGTMLRFWRNARKFSQLELALAIDVSSKHLSFLETGKSQPSRDIILKIARALNIPYRHRNTLLRCAGYSPEYREYAFDDQKMNMVRDALQHMIDKHEPYPAIVINSAYDILMANSGFVDLVSLLTGPETLKRYPNSMELLFANDGLCQYVRNWSFVRQFLTTRLYDESLMTQNAALMTLYKKIAPQGADRIPPEIPAKKDLPFMTLSFEKDTVQANLFTTIAVIGTPLDAATQELRVELFFPADTETKVLFDQWGGEKIVQTEF